MSRFLATIAELAPWRTFFHLTVLLQRCLLLLARGDDSRAVRSTVMNQMSSRSHTIFQLLIEKTKTEDGGEAVVTRSKLNLVDLAGSEKWNVHDESIAGAHVSELQNINLSLHTLARCIRALSASVHEHVPFRESKLTRILQDSLGGTARTCVIATLSPSALNFAETISTLKFADQAKQVMQYVRVHAVESVDMALVQRLREEIQKLQFSNAKLRASAGQQETHRGDSSSESPGQTYKRTAVPNAHRGAPAQTVTHNKHHQIAASVLDEVVATLNGLKGALLTLLLYLLVLNVFRFSFHVVVHSTQNNTRPCRPLLRI